MEASHSGGHALFSLLPFRLMYRNCRWYMDVQILIDPEMITTSMPGVIRISGFDLDALENPAAAVFSPRRPMPY